MPSPRFAELERALTCGGVAAFYVERTLLELREHYDDLERDALGAGMSRDEAERWALASLGNEQTIAAVILAHPELRDWSERWPRAASCLRVAIVVATLPEAPVVFIVERGRDLARWGAAVGAAALFIGSLLALLNSMITI